MRLSQSFISTGLIALSFGMVACKSETAVNTTSPEVSGTPSVGNSTTSSVASINAELYLKIERKLQTPANAATILVGLCQVPMGAPRGTVVTCNPTVGGSFSIPEGDLHYSKMTFTSGTNDPGQCAYLIFRPYYYIGSASPAFLPTWNYNIPTTTVRCTPTDRNVSCYNGPAVTLVPDFPKNDHLVYFTNFTLEASIQIDSGFTNDQRSNRFTMNKNSSWATAFTDPSDSFGRSSFIGDTPAAACAVAGDPCFAPASSQTPLGYAAGHQDYAVECRDKYYDLIFGVKVIMDDEDTVTGQSTALDYYHTWNP